MKRLFHSRRRKVAGLVLVIVAALIAATAAYAYFTGTGTGSRSFTSSSTAPAIAVTIGACSGPLNVGSSITCPVTFAAPASVDAFLGHVSGSVSGTTGACTAAMYAVTVTDINAAPVAGQYPYVATANPATVLAAGTNTSSSWSAGGGFKVQVAYANTGSSQDACLGQSPNVNVTLAP